MEGINAKQHNRQRHAHPSRSGTRARLLALRAQPLAGSYQDGPI
jgi:hypothetical protein